MSTSTIVPTATVFLDTITIPMTELPRTGTVLDPTASIGVGLLAVCIGLGIMAARDGLRARRTARQDVTE